VKEILAGVETEYGLHTAGHGADHQIEDATALVKSYPGECLPVWDYRYESPRSDLRGFKLESLSFDPIDSQFDAGKSHGPAHEVRADRVLPNGARLYNDHGHPEYSTPECWSLRELSLHDRAGQDVVLAAAKAFEAKSGQPVSLYKNNTDFHGASYGTHESYLVPRSLAFAKLHQAVLPMLIVRQILTGAGKVGSENRQNATYQLSQRADFFAETTNAETLFRRPIFNTRDEPHSNHADWVRLHVISGDANMIPSATARKAGLVKLALQLALVEEVPVWTFRNPVQAFQSISRDETYEFKIDLEGQNWTTAQEIFESYFSAAEKVLDLDDETRWVIGSSRELLDSMRLDPVAFRREVDWAAKKYILEQVLEELGTGWSDPALKSYDLEYHNVDSSESLYAALQSMEVLAPDPSPETLLSRIEHMSEDTRARARGVAVRKFKDQIETLSWTSIVFRDGSELLELLLPPDRHYPAELEECDSVGTFIQMIQGAA
jgi:proteasome accessory factor A